MWHLRKPTPEAIDAFLARQHGQTFSYPEVGFSLDQSPPGYDTDISRIMLGRGEKTFAAACAAVNRWAMFPAPWTKIFPENAPIQKGTAVAMLAHVFGLWWLNSCRIVYILDEREPMRRYGFAYGTLPAHVERGEERFTIEWHADDTVWYDIRAFSQPRYWLVRLGYPLARRLQSRFRQESLQQMVRLTSNP